MAALGLKLKQELAAVLIQGTLGNLWRHSRLSRPGAGGVDAWHSEGRGQTSCSAQDRPPQRRIVSPKSPRQLRPGSRTCVLTTALQLKDVFAASWETTWPISEALTSTRMESGQASLRKRGHCHCNGQGYTPCWLESRSSLCPLK